MSIIVPHQSRETEIKKIEYKLQYTGFKRHLIN